MAQYDVMNRAIQRHHLRKRVASLLCFLPGASTNCVSESASDEAILTVAVGDADMHLGMCELTETSCDHLQRASLAHATRRRAADAHMREHARSVGEVLGGIY